jgi:hypothetical protein
MGKFATILYACAIAILAIGAAGACAAAAEPCGYRDYMPGYAKFLAQTADLSPDKRADAFVADYAAAHPDFYWSKLYGNTAKLRARAGRFFDPARRPQFPGFPPLSDARVLALAHTVGPQFAVEQRRFVQVFADFHCDTQVEFGPSLLVFDGHPDEIGGRKYLLFGVDTIAVLHGPADMPAFFDHELFHLYHHQALGNEEPKGDNPGWWTMWLEGLATYVSQRMNPALDAQHVLWLPTDMVARMQTQTQSGARLVLADIDKTGPEADRWFLANQSVDGMPQRVGYYFGYLFAKSIGDGQPLTKLARMKPDDVHAREVRFLTALAKS